MNLTEVLPTEYPMKQPQPLQSFKCRSCKHEVATTDGIDLYFGCQKVVGSPLRVTLLCPHCRRPLEWHSTRAGIPLTAQSRSKHGGSVVK